MAEETSEVRAARGARTQSLFRDVNEQVNEINHAFTEFLPLGEWVCECADDACTERLQVSPGDYERVRADPTRFVVSPSERHVDDDIEDVVERTDDYWVVAKRGAAAKVATMVDPRAVG